MTASGAEPRDQQDDRTGDRLLDRKGFAFFVAALLAIAALFLGKAVIGETFVSTETIYRSVQPWSGMEPAAPPAVSHNENLADPPTVWLPMQAANRSMARDWLSGHGEPPLWCSQNYAGAPWLGNMSSALFSPFTWLFIVLPFGPAFAICAAAKWLLAGIGAWLLARRLGIAPLGRALAGIAFAFCGFQIVWINSCLTNVSVWAPWLLLAIERLLERPSRGRIGVLALVSWQVLVGGHPETSLYVGLGAVVFAACRWFGVGEKKLGTLGALLVAGAIAGLLSIVQWWPFLEYALHSFGNELRQKAGDLFRPVLEPVSWRGALNLFNVVVGVRWLALRGLRWSDGRRGGVRGGLVTGFSLLLFVFIGVGMRMTGLRPTLLLLGLPDLFGRSLDGGHYSGPLTYNDVTAGFAGCALLVLAAATVLHDLLSRRRDPIVRALALATLIVAARFFRIPLLAQGLNALPGLATTGGSRALAMVALLVALLAAIGLTTAWSDRRLFAKAMFGVLAFFGGVMVPVESIAAGDEAENVGGDWFGLRGPPPTAAAVLAGGSDGLGFVFDIACAHDTQSMIVTVNSRELGRVTPIAQEPGTGMPWSRGTWRWVGSPRVEDGLYHVVLEEERADKSRTTDYEWWLDLTRTPRFDPRWLVPLGSLALLLLLIVTGARFAVPLLVVATIAELAFFGARYQETTPPERLPQENLLEPIPFLEQKQGEALQSGQGPFRVFTARTHLHPNLPLLFDDPPIDVVRGYDALEPLDYIHVLNELYRDHLEVPWVEMDASTLDFGGARGKALTDFLGVRYLVSEEPAPPGFHEVWRQQPARPGQPPLLVHENPDALPRAFLVQRGLCWREPFPADPRQVAIFDSADPTSPGVARYGPNDVDLPGYAKLTDLAYARGRIGATVESENGTLLIVSENCGGWQATIDGASAPIRRTHGAFLSVTVPSGGRHRVELVYRPWSVVFGLGVSLVGLLALLALLLPLLRRAS